MYQGAITLSRNSDSMVVPVSVAVAATPAQDAAGNLTGVTQFGGTDVANAQSDQLYNNGVGLRRQRLGLESRVRATGGSTTTTCSKPRRRARCS